MQENPGEMEIIKENMAERISDHGNGSESLPDLEQISFFKPQVLRTLRNRGIINADSIEEYIARDGYLGMVKALKTMTPVEIIEEIKKSGLRGRGGAGFPTGLKWEFANKAKGDIKYILCNGDEGDPGAFMDRSVLEADPHAVIEGMVIGAKAIGSAQGYVYVRAEYPLAVKTLGIAIKKAYACGFLGKDILGTGFDFDLDIYLGAGAFVCGEETALMRSIQGQRGMPRPRPPFPAHKGLWDRPSVLNNVETLANIGQIILHGAGWYASLGTERSKGTKVFALSGAINNIGLVEVPMGISLKSIIFDIGGGIKKNKMFKAVQLGGPSGGCVPANLLDTPVDYESIAKTGAIMGSGGMVVMDESTCMVDAARFFLDFTQDESCGKCVPCRVGTRVLNDLLVDITRGNGKPGDIELLEDLSYDICMSSLCGLGQTAPNPVLTTIRYFRKEYEEHIKYKSCSAVVCKKIIYAPCQYTCPVGLDVPAYVTLIGHGRFEQAYHLIMQNNPLPGICGRVCHHPCQVRCRRGELDEPIRIKHLKRFVADWALKHNIKSNLKPKTRRQEKVAVVGSGPAGLTCAHYLALEGYQVTIFEELPVAGGMLAVGIPDYRLPPDILNYEIGQIQALGVEIKLNTKIGNQGMALDDLKSKGYKAVFLTPGAHRSLKLKIPGEDVQGLIDCTKFLRAVNLGQKVSVGKRVGVIGGGNAAVDAARVALRLDAEEVTIIYRRTRAEMPADRAEVDAAEHEGVKLMILISPLRVVAEDGRMTGLECQKNVLGEPDSSGRRRPVPVAGSEFILPLDNLIPAISQEPDLDFLGTDFSGLEITRWNTISANKETLITNKDGIFSGGDAVSGPNTVIEAMQAGKTAAKMIFKYLHGEKVQREYSVVTPLQKVELIELKEEDSKLAPARMPEMDADKRLSGFDEVELGFEEVVAMNEAKRCLRCDIEEE